MSKSITTCSYNQLQIQKTQYENHVIKNKLILFSASISLLACPFGVLISGILMDIIGRKKALQVIYIPMILSWLILAFANSYKTLLIAKILLGIPYGKFLYICFLNKKLVLNLDNEFFSN